MKRLLVLSLTLGLSACNGGKDQTNIELIQDMMDQINVKAQDWNPDAKDGLANFYPPDNTVPRGYKPVPFKGDPIAANEKLMNPMAGDMSPETLSRGKEKYEIYCGVCHGETLAGNGPVAAKMILKPPTLLSEKVRGHKDGRLFYIISYGQGVMGSYATQLHNQKDRWAIVNYIRSVQKRSAAGESVGKKE